MKDYLPLIQTILWIALILLGILMFRKPLLERIERGASVKVGPVEIGALEEKVKDVQKEVSDLSERVAKVFLFAMPDIMYDNLKKLSSGKFGDFEMSLGLERELYHMRDMGYIQVESIKGIPSQGSNLSDHVKITETGQRFVEIRDSVMSS
jgi:hypothetical protein